MYKSLHIYLCHTSSKKINFTSLKTHCRSKLACNIGVFIPYMYCLHNAVATSCNWSFSSFSKVGNWQLQSSCNWSGPVRFPVFLQSYGLDFKTLFSIMSLWYWPSVSEPHCCHVGMAPAICITSSLCCHRHAVFIIFVLLVWTCHCCHAGVAGAGAVVAVTVV